MQNSKSINGKTRNFLMRMDMFIKMNINLICVLFLLTLTNLITAQTNSNHIWVDGYLRSDGKYVRGHYKTASNHTVNDNFSTIGNINPYTDKRGYIPRESEYTYDEKINSNIPSDFIFSSRKLFQLEIVNSLNIYSDKIRVEIPDMDLFAIRWNLIDGDLVSYTDLDIWNIYEKEAVLRVVAHHFGGIEALLGIRGYLNLIQDSGIKKVKIYTKKNEYTYSIYEIEKAIISKN
jgi:hypothetical protein